MELELPGNRGGGLTSEALHTAWSLQGTWGIRTYAENTSTQPGGCCGRDVPALSTTPAQAHVHLLKARLHSSTGLSCSAASSRNARPGPS
ncbi:hypothetical protein D623_10007822 [Myotis brandtii]|uniref:Uncharacterized protein n=1 Tax=Myotis brandtii TaxID=109478 RepID=S7Q836_MYOBR|nr:hypothetical protein D623_10007822 [Myotis brandtii]